jgi:hypothetical protein
MIYSELERWLISKFHVPSVLEKGKGKGEGLTSYWFRRIADDLSLGFAFPKLGSSLYKFNYSNGAKNSQVKRLTYTQITIKKTLSSI